jgi:hypothetical protein
VSLNVTDFGPRWSGWVAIPVLGVVWLRLAGSGGNGVADPSFGLIGAGFR